MQRCVTLCVLTLLVWGCNTGQANRAELQSYVEEMAGLEAQNREIAQFIIRLDQPSYEITEADLEQARVLVNQYVDQIQARQSTDMRYREMRVTHSLYQRKLAEVRDLVADTGRELRRERMNVAIGMRQLERLTQQHYTALDVLWLRTSQAEPFPLAWPQ